MSQLLMQMITKRNHGKRKAGTVVNLYRGYENEHSNSEYIKDAKLPDIFKFMMGMTYEQFKYQIWLGHTRALAVIIIFAWLK